MTKIPVFDIHDLHDQMLNDLGYEGAEREAMLISLSFALWDYRSRRRISRPKHRDPKSLLRDARMTAGLTQGELAQRSGLVHETISRLEHGYREPSLRTLNKIASALDIPVSNLVEVPVS